MTGHETQDDLLLYALGQLPREAAVRIQNHVSLCSECQEQLHAALAGLGGLGMSATVSPPSHIRGQLMAKVRVAGVEQRRVRRHSRLIWVPVFVSVLLALVLIWRWRDSLLQKNRLAASVAREAALISQLEDLRKKLAESSAGEGSAVSQSQKLRQQLGTSKARESGATAQGEVLQQQLMQSEARESRAATQIKALQQQLGASEARERTTSTNVEALRQQLAASKAQENSFAAQVDALRKAFASPDSRQFPMIQVNSRPLPEGKTIYRAREGTLVFIGSHLKSPPAGKAYVLWLLPASGGPPIAAGTFKPDRAGNASLLVPHLPAAVEANGFAITIEDETGSAKPTPPFLLTSTPS